MNEKIRKEDLRRTRKRFAIKVWTKLEMSNGWTQTNGPEDNKIDDNAQSFTSGRLHEHTICVKKRKKRIRQHWGLSRSSGTMRTKKLIIAASNHPDNIRSVKNRKQKREEQQPYGYFKWQIGEIAYEKTCTWLKKRETLREKLNFL